MKELNENSGLVLMDYKEPLKKVEEGFGYYGAILLTLDGKKLQCHICGGLYASVGVHLRHQHNMTAVEYKKMFGLAFKTALVSEETRAKLKEGAYFLFHGLTKKQREEREKNRIEASKKSNKERKTWTVAAEVKNKYGTCPDQTLAKIEECAEHLGYTPSRREFHAFCGSQRYLHLCKSHFGSWTGALKRLGLKNKNREHGLVFRKSNEELLAALKEFWQTTGKIPTASDSYRLNIPGDSIYSRRFGGWQKARQLAGIPELEAGHPTWIKEEREPVYFD